MSAPIPADYWVASATVAPVLALALVVEARAVLAKWTPETPPLPLRVLASLWWFAPLAAFFYLEPVMLDALRGIKPASWVPGVFEITVSVALANLALTPALDIAVRANADLLAALLSRHPVVRVLLWRMDRRVSQSRRYIAEGRQYAEQMVATLADLDEMRAEVDALNPPDNVPDADTDALRERISTARAEVEKLHAETLRRLDRAEQAAQGHTASLDAVRLRVAEVTTRQRRELREAIFRGDYEVPTTAGKPDEK